MGLSLYILAGELLPEADAPSDPLGAALGEVRVLHNLPLGKLEGVCIQPPGPIATRGDEAGLGQVPQEEG